MCALVSGGLDSAVLLHRLSIAGTRILPVYVRCGFIWERTELAWLRRLVRHRPGHWPLRVIDVPMRALYGEHWSFTGRRIPGARSDDAAVYLPGRNALLLSAAAVAADERNIGTLALGTLKGNPFGDATPAFFRRMGQALSLALRRRIRIIAPLSKTAKARLISGAGTAPLQLTFSCLRPRGLRHCGRCNKCAERQRAFRLAGIKDPTSYVS